MRRLASAGIGALTLLHALSVQAEVLTIESRPGVKLRFDLQLPAEADALVLLFEGGGGRLSPSSDGFAYLTHQRLAGLGLASALIDAPSDQRDFRGGMQPGFRQSDAHLRDIDAVVAALRARSNLPFWLLGISMGTRSAAWYAAQRPGRVDGVVLLSSSTNHPKGESVVGFPLDRIGAPLLAIAHQDDGCSGTPPEGARRIVAAATASRTAEARFFSGGQNSGRRPCGTRTHHTFYGIENEVISAIAAFIAENSP